MKPLIKWPGGKSREIARIRAILPPARTLVEPFVGGGALFFRLEPAAALLNDAEADLVDFYRAVREEDVAFREALLALAADREEVARRAVARVGGFARYVALLRAGIGPGGAADLARSPADRPLALGEPAEALLARCVEDKARRLLGLERKHDKVFAGEELAPHFQTALQSGLYTAVRDLPAAGGRAGALARFYFLRQMCYGSMFRYSRDGRFNIPYGGISYNRVDFRQRAERLFSAPVRTLLGRAEFTCEDFEAFLGEAAGRLADGAVVFLDPPYDTEFSSYANRSFGREDQERLARVFERLPCPALLVIQETEWIRGLYEEAGRRIGAKGRPFFLTAYGKTYGYNVRGRNERRARHLLVGNYAPAGPAAFLAR